MLMFLMLCDWQLTPKRIRSVGVAPLKLLISNP